MRTKQLLLTATALLAAGLLKTQATPVYSQNIVGYASIPLQTAGQYYMMSCPFVVGVSNGVNEIFGTSLPDGTSIFIWSSGSQSFKNIVYDSTGGNDSLPYSWFQADDTTPVTFLPTNAPGMAFFIVPNQPVTNTFVGAVAVSIGTSNNMVLPTGGQYYMVASAVPYAGYVTNGTKVNGGPNLNGLPDGSSLFQWNPLAQSFTTYVYDSTGGNDSLPFVWFQADDTTPAPCPQINVGDGFFLVPNNTYTWTTGL